MTSKKTWFLRGMTVLALLAGIMGCKKADDTAAATKTADDAKPAASKTGSAASTASAGGKITIWWAQWAPADGLQNLGKQYQEQTGVEVEVHQIPWQSYQDQVFLEFGNPKTSFDVVVGDSQWIGRGATKGLYMDLSDWLPTAVDLKTIHPAALNYLCAYPAGSTKYYATPCETDATGFAYRKDWFADPKEQAAFKAKYKRDLVVPQTWEEFKDIAEFFTRPADKRYGCALLTGRGYDALTMGFQPFLWSFGGTWGDPKTFAVNGFANNAGAVQGLTFMKSLLAYAPKGSANQDYGDTLEAMTNGSTAMAMDFFAFFPTISKAMGDKVGYFPMPTHDGKRFVSLGGQGFSISAKTSPAQQALAKKFISWFLQPAIQREWITHEAGFTASTGILTSQAFADASPYNAAFAKSLDSMQDFWNIPPYNELLAVVQRNVGQALDGEKSPKEALDALATEHEAIMKEAGFAKK